MDMPENMRDEDQEDDEEGGGDGEAKSGKAKAPSSAEMELVAKQQALLRRYSNDYSRYIYEVALHRCFLFRPSFFDIFPTF